jgi:hypothetical protein
MPTLIAILIALMVISIPEPFRTILWVVVVIIAVFAFLDISGLYSLRLR